MIEGTLMLKSPSAISWVAILACLLGGCGDHSTQAASPAVARVNPLPPWTGKFIARGSADHPTLIEEATYEGNRVFHIMPGDEADDGGSEHVLYSEGGKWICTFGGLAAHVTAGSCDIEKIIYVRTLYPAKPVIAGSVEIPCPTLKPGYVCHITQFKP